MSDIGKSALAGAVTGALGGLTLGFGGTVLVGAGAGFAGDALGTYLTSGEFNLADSTMAGWYGGLGGVYGYGLGKLGVGAKMGLAAPGVLTGIFGLKYNYDSGAVAEGCSNQSNTESTSGTGSGTGTGTGTGSPHHY